MELPDPLIKIGLVIRVFVEDTTPKKEKRLVIVGEDNNTDSFVALYFQSEINPFVNRTIELQALHIRFTRIGRPYLTKDSYLDCSKVHFYCRKELIKAYRSDNSVIIGEVSRKDLSQIFSTLIHAPTIKGKDKKRYGFFHYLDNQ